MNATFQGGTPVKLLSFKTLEETEKIAAAEASSYEWASAAATPSIAKETPVSGSPEKAYDARLTGSRHPLAPVRPDGYVIYPSLRGQNPP